MSERQPTALWLRAQPGEQWHASLMGILGGDRIVAACGQRIELGGATSERSELPARDEACASCWAAVTGLVLPSNSDLERISQKLRREEALTPEEQALMAKMGILVLASGLYYGAKGLRRLSEAATAFFTRLSSPEVRHALEEFGEEIQRDRARLAEHQRQIDAEHRDDESE